MKATIKEIFDFIVGEITEIEKTAVERTKSLPKSELLPGCYYSGADIRWDDRREFFMNFNCTGLSVGNIFTSSRPKLDISHVTNKMIVNELVPLVKEWFQKRVDECPYGGLYSYAPSISLGLYTEAIRNRIDSEYTQSFDVETLNTKKREQLKKRVGEFIKNNEAETHNLVSLSGCIKEVFTIMLEDCEDFGIENVKKCITTLLDREKVYTRTSEGSERISVMNMAENILREANLLYHDGRKERYMDVPPEMALFCAMIQWDYYPGYGEEREHAVELIEKLATEVKYDKAIVIHEVGSGAISKDVMVCKNELIDCKANDFTKRITIKLKKESEDSYKAALEYIVRLIRKGFTKDYEIQFKSKVKNYVPVKVKKTVTNQFFANCGQYLALLPLLEEYANETVGINEYYTDVENPEDEETNMLVKSGGYALYMLAFADEKYLPLVKKYVDWNGELESVIIETAACQSFSLAESRFTNALLKHYPNSKEMKAIAKIATTKAKAWKDEVNN